MIRLALVLVGECAVEAGEALVVVNPRRPVTLATLSVDLALALRPKLLYLFGVFGFTGALLYKGIQFRLYPLDGLRIQLALYLQVVCKIVQSQHD